ncbi:MAG: hypothetical protein DME97_08285 [Verrucomicrobia bacterium]|nr:MAG: hypothetical protein DME97_08285 [Verrucomicrobiota bacterium]
MCPASLRALLAHSIDYAGLFPPANLALEPALRNQSQYVRLPESWMLGAFVLPIAEFDAAARHLSDFDNEHPLRISALGPRTDNAEAFLKSLSATIDAIATFQSRFATAAIEQLEMPLPTEIDAELLKAIHQRLGDSNLKFFGEAKADAAERVMELLSENNGANPGSKLGFKLRTGGVTAEAFPSSAQIATALMAAGTRGVPIKFTAGLHHPVRLFHDSVQTTMHGFLNVLGAGVLALEHDWTQNEIIKMLEDEDAGSFSFTEDFFAWRERKISTKAIAARRELVTSFGSCSFDEPREDLRALKLL